MSSFLRNMTFESWYMPHRHRETTTNMQSMNTAVPFPLLFFVRAGLISQSRGVLGTSQIGFLLLYHAENCCVDFPFLIS